MEAGGRCGGQREGVGQRSRKAPESAKCQGVWRETQQHEGQRGAQRGDAGWCFSPVNSAAQGHGPRAQFQIV